MTTEIFPDGLRQVVERVRGQRNYCFPAMWGLVYLNRQGRNDKPWLVINQRCNEAAYAAWVNAVGVTQPNQANMLGHLQCEGSLSVALSRVTVDAFVRVYDDQPGTSGDPNMNLEAAKAIQTELRERPDAIIALVVLQYDGGTGKFAKDVLAQWMHQNPSCYARQTAA